jgi:hypothetical protein
LNPIVASDEPVGDPPPKITLNGIMSAYGKLQALFKVAGTGKAGQPAKDQFYILSEGQRQDDIEITRINEQAGLVTFNNHGTVQEIPLANAPAVTTSSAPGPGGQVPKPGFTGPRGGGRSGVEGGNETGNASRRGAGRQNRGRGNGANQNPDMSTAGGGSTAGSGLSVQSLLSVPTRAGNVEQQQNPNALTPEESAILIEAQREMYRSQNNPIHGIFPPTKYTPPDATGPTGNPLVMPVVPPPVAPSQ